MIDAISDLFYGHVSVRLSQFFLLPPAHWLATSHDEVDLHQPQLYFEANSKHAAQLLAISLQL